MLWLHRMVNPSREIRASSGHQVRSVRSPSRRFEKTPDCQMQANEITVINETVILKYFHWFRPCAVSFFVSFTSFFEPGSSEWDRTSYKYSLYHRNYGRQSEPRELESRTSVTKKIFFTSQTSTDHQPTKQSFKQ